MRALILAAGRGSRMGRHTKDRPKVLLDLDGMSLLDRHDHSLRTGGAHRIAIVSGYRADLLTGYGDRTFHAPRWSQTNMVVSLTAAHEWLCAATCLVAYGDIFYPAETVRELIEAPGQLAIAYDPHWLALWSRRFDDPLDDAETFRLSESGNVSEIGSRANNLADVAGQFMGLLRFTPAVWERVCRHLSGLDPEVRDRLDTTSLLAALIADGEQVTAVACTGPWGEIDHPTDLDLYRSAMCTAGKDPGR
ncbi:phosphocholine cytidylyltransferase family protein [Nocardia puris]|uniref:phosphocholine cytidylyltransferase family protein n=1 Tax=Nocardia puris TaxID=208602 RepID=UPI001896071A|nr:phosphocholine cytidylyltransferase family protein [Nocardia puris]MBF6370351.1 phosphocholine cytidylyltransferase family protein [Nocardia puris]